MAFSISGLTSNLDTSQIVTDLMKIERQPYDRLAGQKQNLGSEQGIFRTLNNKLSTLKTAVADLLQSATYNQATAKSSDETVLKVTADEGVTTGNFDISVTQTAKAHAVKSNAVNVNGSLLLGKDFTLQKDGGALITVDTSTLAPGTKDGDVMEYIKNQINQRNAGVSAAIVSVSATDKVLVLTSQQTGTDKKMVLGTPGAGTGQVGIGGTSLADLGITDISDTGVNTSQKADDAQLKVNGIDIVRGTNQITDVISGATINLLKSGTSTISVAKDADKVAKTIQTFVDAYNDVATMVKDNLKKPADKTKMNPLQGDAVLKEVSDRLYTMLTGLVNTTAGKGMINQLGLTIDKGITKPELMTRTITFDQAAFKDKFNSDPNFVSDLFRIDDTSPGDQDGVTRVLDKQLLEWTRANGLFASKIAGYDSEIKMIDDRMVGMDERLQQKEAQLKRQFTAMEVSLTKLKNEQSWLTGQFAAIAPNGR